MAQPSIIQGDFIYQGTVTFGGTMVLPDNAVTNAKVIAAAGIDSSKVIHRFSLSVQLFAPGVTIAAVTSQLLHVCRKGGQVIGAEAAITTTGGGDRTVDVQIQKSTGGAAFANILSSAIAIGAATAVRTAVAGVVGGSATFVNGDILAATVTLGGSSGSYPAGLILTVDVDQNPNT